MSNVNTDGLPPEMQARIAQIIEGAKQKAVANTQPQPEQQAPIVKPPSLMDHVVALRQEVAVLNQQVAAQGQVIEAVGNAVGQLYAMFQPSPGGVTQSETYSSQFQGQQVDGDY